MTSSPAYALLSVSDKTGIVALAQDIAAAGYRILSSGGTYKLLQSHHVDATEVSAYTGFPEMMHGRVKTLHPKIHGGLLAKRDDGMHMAAAELHDISMIDIVVVNLYPFEETVARTDDAEEIIENVDIGGPSMVRSAAKNHENVTIITDADDYAALSTELTKGAPSAAFRKRMAAKAFARTAAYDAAIAAWFTEYADAGEEEADGSSSAFPKVWNVEGVRYPHDLRYGENPHQAAAFYTTDAMSGIGAAKQLHGKQLGYNNISDADAAMQLAFDFNDPAVAIIKHANPCGVAVAPTQEDAYVKAFACDSVSAFGGIVALNRPVNAATAAHIAACFYEAVIAPGFDDDALALLTKKKNIRLLHVSKPTASALSTPRLQSVIGGFLAQERDNSTMTRDMCRVVTERAPTEDEWRDLLFAFSAVKHVRSNAVLFARDGAAVGIGAGQMSRVDAVRFAAIKASDGDEGNRAVGSVLASDAFFPFADGAETALNAGATALIQPGGSKRDDEVIAAANKAGAAMVFTGTRVFKH